MHARGASRNGYAGRSEHVTRVVIADAGGDAEPVVLAGIAQHYAPVRALINPPLDSETDAEKMNPWIAGLS